MSGIGKVVLGDLVCCKQNTYEKPVVDVKNDPEDTSSDEHDCSILEADVSEATLPAEKIDFVKVRNLVHFYWVLKLLQADQSKICGNADGRSR